jgi:hypothetical protein
MPNTNGQGPKRAILYAHASTDESRLVGTDARSATRNGVFGRNTKGIGVQGTSSAPGLGAVEGHNNGRGSGVVGVGKVGMLAFSHTDGWNAVWGRHTGTATRETAGA